MFAKVYQYKFPSITEAKVAASFCSDHLGKQIAKYNFQSLNILIGKEGDLSIFIKFEGWKPGDSVARSLPPSS